MRNSFTPAQLDEGLKRVYTVMGTDYPSEKAVKGLYLALCDKLYPPAGTPPIHKTERPDYILYRRAMERAHPFLLKDTEVIRREKRRQPADSVDIVRFVPTDRKRPGRGLVILRRRGREQVIPFYGDYPEPLQEAMRWQLLPPALHTILANLLHRKNEVTDQTPVQEYNGSYDKAGRLLYAPTGSAMPLWAYLNEPG